MIAPTTGGILIDVRVVPRAGRTALAGTRDGALLVRLSAAPVDGAANIQLVALLARTLGVARGAVTIVAGERGRRKRVHVAGASAAHARETLGE